MDIEKLIEQYMQAADKWEKRHPVTDTFDLRVQDALRDAATALSTLQAENEKLRAELEKVKAERGAAIKDLNEFLSMDELCPIQCEWCKWNGTHCYGKTPEWRGIKEN